MTNLRVEAGVSTYYLRRQRQARVRRIKRIALAVLLLVLGASIVGGIVYAGAPSTLASGIEIEGVDVGGLTAGEARTLLERRYRAVESVPVTFTAGGRAFRVRAPEIGLRVEWGPAVTAARRDGDGFGPFRGFRRMKLRLFGEEVAAKTVLDEQSLGAKLAQIAGAVDRPHREAALDRRGLKVAVVPGKTGVVVDRDAAARVVAAALASLERVRSVALPLASDPPRVTARGLAQAAAQARTALSAPVRLTLGPTYYRVPRWRIAELLKLPSHGATKLSIAGPGADAFFRRLEKIVNTPPKDARFVVAAGGGIRIKPSVDGRALDEEATAKRLLAAAVSPASRTAKIVVATKQAERTTSDAKAMGITGLVSSYTTVYGGIPNRIFNVQLVSRLIDDTLIAPGKTFSFNGTTGERTPEKGFKEAPVIINGELQTALGGGVCQVSTTVFNAAYDAGLPITERTNHYLYISHYPQGRDATVNYPDLDLKFVNDTGSWLLLRTFVSSSSLTVNLYGTPQNRRVESDVAPLRVTGPPPTTREKDPTLEKGKQVVVEAGSPALATSVTRRVYDADGKLLSESTWYSSYRGEKRIVRVGTKKPEPKEPTKLDAKTKAEAEAIIAPH